MICRINISARVFLLCLGLKGLLVGMPVMAQVAGREAFSEKKVLQSARQQQMPQDSLTGYEKGHEWIDLGLSVKWATCNVGAGSPEEPGGLYAWGETHVKSNYYWSNCFDCLDSTGDHWNMYRTDGRKCISPSDGHDAARRNWGGSWRMPTREELQELYSLCSWRWNAEDGVYGYTVMGPNGRSIYLPCGGIGFQADYYLTDVIGSYWSSTLSTTWSGYAYYLGFTGGGYYIDDYSRNTGRNIRPVMD